jgi:hypothetical protein
LKGTYLSGGVPASVQTVDSDYLIVRSSSSATSPTFNPSGYSLLGNTSWVSGTTGDLVSNNGVNMTFRSYSSATSPQTLTAHQETTTIGGTTYYLQWLTGADATGTDLSVSGATKGRKLVGKFVYRLTGVSSIPASTWTIYYRAVRGSVMDAHADVDILIRRADGIVRETIATNVANSAKFTTSWSTLSGTYAWSAYTVVDQTDYLEIDYYIEVTTASSGKTASLRIDDSALVVADQTRATNIYLPSEYTSEVEFSGSSNTETWTQLVWSIDSAWTVGAVKVTIQVYNYALGGYPTSGNGYDNYTSNSTANTDETRTQTITTNSTHFHDGSGNWKIKVKGVKATTNQFDFKADWIKFEPTYYSEYVVSTEFLFSSMTTKTPTQLNFTVVSQYNMTGASVTIQVWNYSSSAYATSGQAYLNYTSSGTNETKTLSITANPQFYTSNGNAKIKIRGVLATPNQFQQEINLVKLLYSHDIHDVAVISVTASATEVTSGQIVSFTVLVKNNGTVAETFNVTLFYNETVIRRKTVTNLAPGDQKTLGFIWNTTGLDEASYRIQAEASAVSGEVETNNNAYIGAIVKVSTQTSLQPFDWVTPLLYVLPVIFGLLFLLVLKLKRKKKTKPHIAKKTEAFPEQFGMTHQQMVGKKMLLEIDPASDYHKLLLSFVSEAKNNNEPLFIFTNKNSTLHSALSGVENVNFRLLTSKTSSPRQISEKETLLPASDLSVLLNAFGRIPKGDEKTINVLFDNLSDIILRCGFEKTYKFMRLLLEAISSPKTTALFVFNPTAHDQTVSSSIRGLFKNKLAYTKSGPKVGIL